MASVALTPPATTPRGSFSGPSGIAAAAAPSGEEYEVAADRTPRASISGPPSPVNDSQRTIPLGLPTALKPIGIVNEQNTCFLNSTFQALSATAPLISLITESSSSALHPSSSSSLPPAVISPSRIPALQPEALEPPLYSLLPVTRAFISSLHTAWKKKDAGGGTAGPSETRSDRCMSLRSVLREIAKKYDQYDDYRQQDAHELLRHLLDSMEMEEKDVIKRLQPPPPPNPAVKDKRKDVIGQTAAAGAVNPELAGISPLPSPLPSPATSAPTSPTKHKSLDLVLHEQEQAVAHREVPEHERLIPFVDVLFGGSLASIVICERCKSVSHTYEGFLDISLSLKGDDPRPRKRDRIKAFFLGGSSKNAKASSKDSSTNSAVFSDGEFSDAEQHSSHAGSSSTSTKDRDRRASLDSDDRYFEAGSDMKRNVSLRDKIKTKSSFPFRKKGSRPSSSQSIPSPNAGPSQHSSPHASAADQTPPHPLAATSLTSSPSGSLSGTHGGHVHHGMGPSPAQAAYIARILGNGAVPADAHDPLAKLRAANSGQGLSVNNDSSSGSGEYSLLDSLRAFTSVEVLEGENAFACKKCWRIQAGKYEPSQPVLREEDEASGHASSPEMLASRREAPPSISIMTSPDTEPEHSANGLDSRNGGPSNGRPGSLSSSSLSSKAASRIRAPSPLRRAVPQDGGVADEDVGSVASSTEVADRLSLATDADTLSVTSGPTTPSVVTNYTESAADPQEAEGDDGLSDTSSSDDDQEPPPRTHIGRPSMPQRRKSTHYVMRRAFKRYLIAKEPEVLVFHLKRFRQTQKGLVFTSFYDLKKVDDFVPFPPMLDLAPFLAPNRHDYKVVPTATGPRAPYMDWPSPEHGPEHQPVMYRLYAIVVHMGTMIGGHYIAYTLVDPEKMFEQGQEVVDAMRNMDLDNANAAEAEGLPKQQALPARNGAKDRRVWCFCSDTSIRLASVDEVLGARAYLCFYEKAT